MLSPDVAPRRDFCPYTPVYRDPAKRQEELRAFIAEQRRQAKRASLDSATDTGDMKRGGDDTDDGNDDISAWTAAAAGAPPSMGTLKSSCVSQSPRPAVADACPSGVVLGAKRNLRFEVDAEEKAWGCGGRVGEWVSEERSGDDIVPESEAEDRRIRSNDVCTEGETGGGGEDKRGASRSRVEVSGAVGGAVCSLPRSPSEDILVELSALESFVVDELHEVLVTIVVELCGLLGYCLATCMWSSTRCSRVDGR